MQNLGLANMGAYPYVRAAIIGHANKDQPGNCEQVSDGIIIIILPQYFLAIPTVSKWHWPAAQLLQQP